MLKYLITAICCSLFGFLELAAQGQFSLMLPPGNIHNAIEMPDGDIVMTMAKFGGSAEVHTVTRFDPYGQEKWSYGHGQDTAILFIRKPDLKEGPSGSVYLNMYLDSVANRYAVGRVGKDGTLLWVRSGDLFTDIEATSDGGVMVGGFQNIGGFAMTKFDSLGNAEWSNHYDLGFAGPTVLSAILETNDGYIALGNGRVSPTVNAESDLFWMKTDFQGNSILSKQFGDPNVDEQSQRAVALADNSIAFVASLEDANNLKSRAAGRISSNGNMLWWKEYDGGGYAETLWLTPQKTLLYYYTLSLGFSGVPIVHEIDSLGNNMWAYNHWGHGRGAVFPSPNGDYIALGSGSFFGGAPSTLGRHNDLESLDCQTQALYAVNETNYTYSTSARTASITNNFIVPNAEFISWFPEAINGAKICDSCTVAANFAFQSNGAQVSFSDSSSGLVGGWLWDFGDGSTDTTQNPSHTYTSSGQYQVCLTALEGSCSDSVCTTINVNLVSLEDQLNAGMNLWPNPAENYLHLDLGDNAMCVSEAPLLFDLTGRKQEVEWKLTHSGYEFGLQSVPKGIYLLKVSGERGQHTFKVLVQ